MQDHTQQPVETFHATTGILTLASGEHCQVDESREENGCLYLRRRLGTATFPYVESWLIPDLGLRTSCYHHSASEPLPSVYNIAVVEITHDHDLWTARDLYVDLVTSPGRPVTVCDFDELSTAATANLVSPAETDKAIERTLGAIDGISRHHDDAMAWLGERGYRLTWCQSIPSTT